MTAQPCPDWVATVGHRRPEKVRATTVALLAAVVVQINVLLFSRRVLGAVRRTDDFQQLA